MTAALFDLVDSDGSGYLEEAEGKAFLRLQNCEDSEIDYYWADLLRTADTNSDGKIDRSEFLAYCLGDTETTPDGDFADLAEREHMESPV